MAQIYDMYRMVKLTKKIGRKLDKDYPSPDQLSGYASRHPATLAVKRYYIKFRPWLSMTDAANVVADCLYKDVKFLESSSEQLPNSGLRIDGLHITYEGRKLIQRLFIVVPYGLLLAWYKEDGKVFIGIMGTIIAVLSVLIGLLAKQTLFKM